MLPELYAFHQFKMLNTYVQITHLNESGISLDLYYSCGNREHVLFAYNNFYVELIVEKITDEIITLHCFQSVKKLSPYLDQINISPITILLQCQ